MAGFNLDDYVDVAERIAEFSAKYPEGSLQSELQPFLHEGFLIGWLCTAYAYRTPGDERPGKGHAYQAVPGKTPYTKDSEAMNAETSAWGRAIVALGFATKKIASKQEVEARQEPASGSAGPVRQPRNKPQGKPAETGAAAGNEEAVFATDEQKQEIIDLKKEIGLPNADMRRILQDLTGQQTYGGIPADKFAAVKEAVTLEGVPFE